jgi:hypothetical protein
VARHPPHSPSKTGVNALMSGRDRTTDAASSSARWKTLQPVNLPRRAEKDKLKIELPEAQ